MRLCSAKRCLGSRACPPSATYQRGARCEHPPWREPTPQQRHPTRLRAPTPRPSPSSTPIVPTTSPLTLPSPSEMPIGAVVKGPPLGGRAPTKSTPMADRGASSRTPRVGRPGAPIAGSARRPVTERLNDMCGLQRLPACTDRWYRACPDSLHPDAASLRRRSRVPTCPCGGGRQRPAIAGYLAIEWHSKWTPTRWSGASSPRA
jgi:hypothetical protein